ncbi:MAG: redoxin domain-containing protein [Bacteroidia bacterium]|nr:redoxin domain-containing protein [Bacteroidia bacterium]
MKKILLYCGGLALVAVVLYLAVSGSEEKKPESAPPPKKDLVSQLPNLKLLGLDGSVNYSREFTGKNVVVLYHPDCDHCQREAKEIRTQIKAFEDYDVWFVASDSFENISQFATDYDLVNHSNVHFARAEVEEIINNFGSIPTPSLYIYSEELQLVKAIEGETKIEEIIKYL